MRKITDFLEKKSTGISISDHKIEAVEIEKKGGEAVIINTASCLVPDGILERGRIKREEDFQIVVERFFLGGKGKKIGFENVVVTLSEDQVYEHIFEIKKEKNRRVEDYLPFKAFNEASKNVPINSEKLAFSYRVIEEGEDYLRIILIATDKDVINEWNNFFDKLGISVLYFDAESLSYFRGYFYKKDNKEPMCLLDIGEKRTNMYLFSDSYFSSAYANEVSESKFLADIARDLNIDIRSAEKEKVKTGMTDKRSKVFKTLKKSVDEVIADAMSLIGSFNESHSVSIRKIAFIGESQIPGLHEYIEGSLGLPSEKLKNTVLENDATKELVSAFGAAIKSLESEWHEKDPDISMKDISRESEMSKESNVKRREKELLRNIFPETEQDKKNSIVSQKKYNKEKIWLLIILIFGIILLVGAYMFRSSEKTSTQQALEKKAVQYSNVQTFSLKVPVAVDEKYYSADSVKGRILSDKIESFPGDYPEMVANSMSRMRKNLNDGEKMWDVPVSSPQKKFPMTIKWLAYQDNEANNLFIESFNKLNIKNIDYALNNIKKTGISETADPAIYYLLGDVSVSTNEKIDILPSQDEQDATSTPDNL